MFYNVHSDATFYCFQLNQRRAEGVYPSPEKNKLERIHTPRCPNPLHYPKTSSIEFLYPHPFNYFRRVLTLWKGGIMGCFNTSKFVMVMYQSHLNFDRGWIQPPYARPCTRYIKDKIQWYSILKWTILYSI